MTVDHPVGKYLEVVRLIRSSGNDVPNWYYHAFTKHISCHITAIMYFSGVKPDNVTFSMFIFGFIGSAFYTIGTDAGYVIGSLFFLILNIADTSDGELARLLNKTSDFGEYLDRLCHYFTNSLMCLALGLGLYNSSGEVFFLYLGFISCAFYVLDDASKDLLFLIKSQKIMERSMAAKSFSLSKSSRMKRILLHLFAHSSVWHVLPLIVGLNMVGPNFNFFTLSDYVWYIVLFLAVIPLKTLFRLSYICKKHRS